MKTSNNTEINPETLREQLSEQRMNEFVGSLVNRDDLDSQRYNLISLASKVLSELLETERELTTDFLKDSQDGFCPACLIAHTRDVTNIESTIELFNKYIDGDNDCDG